MSVNWILYISIAVGVFVLLAFAGAVFLLVRLTKKKGVKLDAEDNMS